MERSVGELPACLAEERLIVGSGSGDGAATVTLDGPATGEFAAPTLAKFADMQDSMLVDPIHEVDEAVGWPHVKAG